MGNESQVENLLRDARLVCDYCAAVGSLKDDKLILALNAVERLGQDERDPRSQEVVELQRQYAHSRTQIPFEVFYSLRNGWTIFPSRSRRWLVGSVVLLSIVFMVTALHLTRIYNRGVELSTGLAALEESDAGRRFGQLERSLLDAGERLKPPVLGRAASLSSGEGMQPVEAAATGAENGMDQFVLAREASHLMVYELVTLDQRIKNLNVLVGEFQQQATYPLVGMIEAQAMWEKLRYWAVCWAAGQQSCTMTPAVPNDDEGETATGAQPVGARIAMAGSAAAAGIGDSQAAPIQATAPIAYSTMYDPRLSGIREIFCDNVGFLAQYTDGKRLVEPRNEKETYIARIAYSVDENFGVSAAKAIIQSCKLNLSYYSGSVPDIASINLRVKDKLNLYSIIILPAMYGALGALVFFMRSLLNPRLPNPGLSQTIYRITLGALAGMILAWLGMGMLGSDEAFKSVGLGLFAFAFILGFSIDVFFDLLDRLVGISRGAVQRVGVQSSDVSAAAATAQAGAVSGTSENK